MPENIDSLKKRLEKRKSSKAIINKRFEQAKNEIAQSLKFDYRITNYNNCLDETVDNIIKILKKYQG